MGDERESSFKVCSMCKQVWQRRSEFLADPAIRAIGYMVNFQHLKLGLFCFNHEAPGCRTTLVVEASHFADLYVGPIFTQRLTGTVDCPGYCLHKDDLRPCPAQCECAYVRAVLDEVTQWKKAGGGVKRRQGEDERRAEGLRGSGETERQRNEEKETRGDGNKRTRSRGEEEQGNRSAREKRGKGVKPGRT